jgi:hypothetical protein
MKNCVLNVDAYPRCPPYRGLCRYHRDVGSEQKARDAVEQAEFADLRCKRDVRLAMETASTKNEETPSDEESNSSQGGGNAEVETVRLPERGPTPPAA